MKCLERNNIIDGRIGKQIHAPAGVITSDIIKLKGFDYMGLIYSSILIEVEVEVYRKVNDFFIISHYEANRT